MHEYSLVQAMYDEVERLARSRGATAVHRVTVRIGESAGVDPGLLASAYEIFRVHTICERAPLEIVTVPVRWTCPGGHGPIAPDAVLRCATCGAPASLEGGDELVLERVELEVP